MKSSKNNFLQFVKDQLVQSADTLYASVETCCFDIESAAELIIDAVRSNHKVLWCGNGGSAAQAQHLSTELVGGLRDHHRSPIPSVSLTTDSSMLTAWSNDVSFETVFSRQVEAIGQKGDILIAISTSGNSKNIVKAVKTATENGLKTVILTGHEGGKLKDQGNVVIRIPSSDTQRIQEGHIAAGHIICEIVEKTFS